jgi:ATP-dependent DNA helicase RecG
VKEKGKITNGEYQELNETTMKTSFRDLDELLKLNILNRIGENRGAYYEINNLN